MVFKTHSNIRCDNTPMAYQTFTHQIWWVMVCYDIAHQIRWAKHTFSGRCDITPMVCCSFGGHSTPQFLQCISVCNNIDDVTCLKTVYDALGDVLAHALPPTPSRKRKTFNRNSEIQRRFHSTRKKRKLSTKLLGKPSIDEVISCELDFNSTETGICAICFCEDDELDHEPVNWIACMICSVWVHKNCANIHNNDFICSYCH